MILAGEFPGVEIRVCLGVGTPLCWSFQRDIKRKTELCLGGSPKTDTPIQRTCSCRQDCAPRLWIWILPSLGKDGGAVTASLCDSSQSLRAPSKSRKMIGIYVNAVLGLLGLSGVPSKHRQGFPEGFVRLLT